MKRLLQSWHLVRIIRLVLGIIITWDAIKTGNWAIATIGILLVLATIANVGCCMTPGYRTGKTAPVNIANLAENIEYEEVR